MQKLIDELELYPAKDTIPSELAEKVLPVFQVNSEQLTISNTPANIVKSAQADGAATTTIYTVPATGKFFLTNVAIAGAGTNAGAISKINVTPKNGSAEEILRMVCPATSIPFTNSMNLQNPVELEPSSLVTVQNAGAITQVQGTIVGYTEAD